MILTDQIQAKIARWLRDQCLTERPQGRVVRFELRHLPIGSKRGEEVDTLTPPESIPSSWYEGRALEIVNKALGDAAGIASGPQRYMLQAFRSPKTYKDGGTTLEASERATARHVFLVAAPDVEEGEGIESEPPTPAGFAAQAFRHLEVTQQMMLSGVGTMMARLESFASRTADENEKLRDSHAEMLETAESLLMERHVKEIEAKKAEAHVEAIKELLPQVKMLAASVLNRVSGKELVPVGDTRANTAQQFLAALTDEERGELFGLIQKLSPAKQIALSELLGNTNNTH